MITCIFILLFSLSVMPKKPERVNQLYKQNSQLNWLTKRARQLDKLNIILQKSLPLQFSQHCHLANIHDDRAVIHTDNASYASMLRYQYKKICANLSEHLPSPVTQIDVKVRPKTTAQQSPSNHKHDLTNKTAALLNNTAAGVEEGPLKQALQKLASRQSD